MRWLRRREPTFGRVPLFDVVFQGRVWYLRDMSQAAIESRPSPQSLIGTWRRFGEIGPVYEIVGVGTTSSAGDPAMRVRVVETNEEVDYRLKDLLDDPIEG